MKKNRVSVCQRQPRMYDKNVDGLENNEQKCSCGHTHAHSSQKIEGGNTHERA